MGRVHIARITPHGFAKARRRAAECPAERGGEVTMTGETEVERKRCEIVCMRNFDEGPREAELHEISMEGRALDAAEDRGQVRGRGPDRPRDVAQPDRR